MIGRTIRCSAPLGLYALHCMRPCDLLNGFIPDHVCKLQQLRTFSDKKVSSNAGTDQLSQHFTYCSKLSSDGECPDQFTESIWHFPQQFRRPPCTPGETQWYPNATMTPGAGAAGQPVALDGIPGPQNQPLQQYAASSGEGSWHLARG